MAAANPELGWIEGGGEDEIPVLPHQFDTDSTEGGDCTRCHQWVRATEVNNRCPARPGQDRGFLQ